MKKKNIKFGGSGNQPINVINTSQSKPTTSNVAKSNVAIPKPKPTPQTSKPANVDKKELGQGRVLSNLSNLSNKNSNNNLNNIINNKKKNKKKGLLKKATETAQNILEGASQLSNMSNKVDTQSVRKYGFIFILAISLILIIFILKQVVVYYYNYAKKGPYLINGTKNATNTVVISQDPGSINYIPIKRSDDENGIEFTYSFWCLYLDSNLHSGNKNSNKWKHIFHKGNSTSYPNRAPGAWFHPLENKMRVYMNTFDNPLEFLDINNIPVRKWFHCAIVLQNKISHLDDEDKIYDVFKGNHILDVYINGKIKKSIQLTGVPKQNNGDVWINLFGGFDGYLSKLQYINRAIKYDELNSIIKKGPSKIVTNDDSSLPPYLDDDWWFNE